MSSERRKGLAKAFPIPAVHNPWKRERKERSLHEFHPLRRAENSIKTPEDDLLDILVAIRLYLLFLDDTDIPLRRLPLADSSKQKA